MSTSGSENSTFSFSMPAAPAEVAKPSIGDKPKDKEVSAMMVRNATFELFSQCLNLLAVEAFGT